MNAEHFYVDHICIDLLPPTMREIAECVGVEAMIKIFDHYNGTRFRVYKKAKPDDKIAQLIGFELYKKLVAEFSGEAINACKTDSVLRQIKRQTVIDLAQQGFTVPNIVRKVNLHERTVFRYLQENKDDSSQLPLI